MEIPAQERAGMTGGVASGDDGGLRAGMTEWGACVVDRVVCAGDGLACFGDVLLL